MGRLSLKRSLLFAALAVAGAAWPPARAQEPAPVPAPAVSGPAAASQPAAQGSAEAELQAIRFRELKTQIANDPRLLAEKNRAARARTAEGRRVLMRNYYTLLYTRIAAREPSLRPLAEAELFQSLICYEQKKVAPSVLLEPVKALPRSRSQDHQPAVPDAEQNAAQEKGPDAAAPEPQP